MAEFIIDWDTGLVIDTFSKNNLREEIVRCRDCKYAMAYTKAAYCEYMNHVVEINGFCAWGERRERESAEVWNQWSANDVTCSEES